MKTWINLLISCLLAASLAACGGGSDSKDDCMDDQDCLDGRRCNFDTLADLGQCMDATVDGFFMCSADKPCPFGQWCFNGLCAPGCMSDADCADTSPCTTDHKYKDYEYEDHSDQDAHRSAYDNIQPIRTSDGRHCAPGHG